MIKFYDDYGDKFFTFSNEFGLFLIVRCDSEQKAYEIMLDESEPINADELPEAYGFYLMQACKYNVKGSTAAWYVCSDLDDHGTITSENTLVCHNDRLTIGGAFKNREMAYIYAMEYIQDQELDLIEGYEYQPNATDSGIVYVGDYLTMRESTPEEIESIQDQIDND